MKIIPRSFFYFLRLGNVVKNVDFGSGVSRMRSEEANLKTLDFKPFEGKKLILHLLKKRGDGKEQAYQLRCIIF